MSKNSEIASLKKELGRRTHDLGHATAFSKELLETTRKLKNEIEVLKQEKYSAQMSLKSKTEDIHTLESELEFQKERWEKAEVMMKRLTAEKTSLSNKFEEAKDENIELSNAVETLTLNNSTCTIKIQELEKELENCRNSLQISYSEEMHSEETMKRLEELEKLKKENADILSHASTLQENLEKAKLSEDQLTDLVGALKNQLEECDRQQQYYASIVEKNKEESAELNAEIEILKMQQVDVNKRGNSLFGEVEDQRKAMEKKLLVFHKKYRFLEEKYEQRKIELQKAKKQISLLLKVVMTKVDGKHIQDMENRLYAAHKEIETLTQSLNAQPRQEIVPDYSNNSSLENGEYKYMQTFLTQAQNKIAKLEKELQYVRMLKVSESENLLQARHELYMSLKKTQELKCQIVDLKMKIQELTVTSLDDSILPTQSVTSSGLKKGSSHTLDKENKENKSAQKNMSVPMKVSGERGVKKQTLMPPPSAALSARQTKPLEGESATNKPMPRNRPITAGNCAQQ